MRFVTLSREDQEFDSYLMGDFSQELVAIPVNSLNVSTQQERITFQILPKVSLDLPGRAWSILAALRLRNLSVVWVPILLVAPLGVPLFPLLLILTSISFLMLAANLRNDVQDHIKGFDRTNTRSGSRVIQKGWLTASFLQKLSWGFLFAAAIVGLPVIWNAPGWLTLLSLTALGIILGLSFREGGLRFSILSVFATGLVAGPMLTFASMSALGASADTSVLIFSVAWGVWYCVVSMVRSLRQLMIFSAAGVNHWMVLLGFDRAKKLILSAYIIATIALLTASLPMMTNDSLGLITWTVLILGSLLFGIRILPDFWRLSSPVGSGLERLNRNVRWQHELFSVCLIIFFIARAAL